MIRVTTKVEIAGREVEVTVEDVHLPDSAAERVIAAAYYGAANAVVVDEPDVHHGVDPAGNGLAAVDPSPRAGRR